ncbi:MAG TPA: serine/threonine-protein kinase, partial [Polyangiaceae bacterium]|nr:serine/threonine-protein kinase [Polyangiaceae bacterium]
MQDDTLRYCVACRETLPGEARFCPACGHDSTLPECLPSPAVARQQVGRRDVDPEPDLPPMRLAPGTRLSVYRIESVLGEGGMGVVYRAYDEALSRPVAIKCLHTNLAGDPEIRRRFEREARLLRTYSHPNVVSVFDFVEYEYLLAIVMELVEGPTLIRYLQSWRGRPPLGEVRDLFGGVLDAMEAGHQRGIIHRDLKPENVLLMRVGAGLRAKVVDFGIAKILEGTTYTVSGMFLGT